ncbi:major facilitator superfamily domain-containing protein, partial [Aspergillus unguis]
MEKKPQVHVAEQEDVYPSGTQLWLQPPSPQSNCVESLCLEEAIPSPNDPLNWPSIRRSALLYAVGFNSFLAAALAPILATGLPGISSTYEVSMAKSSFTIGVYMLGLGVGAAVWAPTASLFGRRPVYVLGSVLLIISSAWAAASPSFPSLVLARLVQGIAASPGEFLVSVTVSEIYTPQERGFRLGIYMLLLAGGKSLAPLIGAAVIQSLGWRWVLWVIAIASAACFIGMFLLARETFWSRDEDDITNPGQLYTANLRISPPLRYSQALSLFNGRLHPSSWFKLAIKPLPMLKSIPLLYASSIYALSLGCLVILAETIAHLFQSVDGYGFNALQTGLLYISPLLGTIIGSVIGGKLSDLFAKRSAARNKGVYEPECRLVMMLPGILITVTGLAIYGWSIEAKTHWMIPTVAFGAVYCGCILGAGVGVTYALDCHGKGSAIDTQVILSLCKNGHGVAFSLFVVDWVKRTGPRAMFFVLAAIHLLLGALSIPLYVYGRRVRVKMGKRQC